MRAVLRSALFSTIAFTFSLFLASCGSVSNPMVSNTPGNSGTGPVPTVAALAVEVNGVAPNRKQEVQFSEAMNPDTINAKTFLVKDAGGNSVTGTVTYDSDYNVAMFQPAPALEDNTQYTATITTGAQSVGGMGLAANYSYSFATRADTDSSPLTVSSVVPAANAQCISPTTTITITFNEAPDASTVTTTNIVVKDSNGNSIPVTLSTTISSPTVTVTPKSPLPSGSITVSVSNVGDLADQMMQQPYTWSFSTACNGGGGGGSGTATAYVYVAAQTPGVPVPHNQPLPNPIYGWAVLADGTLTPVSGSPYNTTDTSYLGVAQNFLFATSTLYSQSGGTGVPAVDSWNIQADGSLAAGPVTSTPPQGTATEGPLSLSFDLSQKDLYANYSNNGTYQAYSIGTDGGLNFINYAATDETSSWLSFTANDAMAYESSCFHGAPSIYGYDRSSSGGLSVTYNPAQPPAPTGLSSGFYCPYGAATISNSNVIIAETPTQIYSSTGPAQMANFMIAGDGSLSTTDTSSTAPIANVGTVHDYRFDPTQTWLAVGGATGIEIFHWANGKLTAGDSFPITGGNGAWLVRWDNAGHLFVLNGNADQSTGSLLYVFNVVNGVPTPAPGSPQLIPGRLASGLAVKPLP